MKLVVYGPAKRIGVVRGDDAVDASLAFAKFLHERKNEPNALAFAEALVPPDLEHFIEGGKRTLDHTQEAVDYLFGARVGPQRPRRRAAGTQSLGASTASTARGPRARCFRRR